MGIVEQAVSIVRLLYHLHLGQHQLLLVLLLHRRHLILLQLLNVLQLLLVGIATVTHHLSPHSHGHLRMRRRGRILHRRPLFLVRRPHLTSLPPADRFPPTIRFEVQGLFQSNICQFARNKAVIGISGYNDIPMTGIVPTSFLFRILKDFSQIIVPR